MNPGDLCLCIHTHEEHFGGNCSRVNCPCKRFVLIDFGPALLTALKQIAVHPVGYGETFNGSAEGGGRPVCHECQQKVEIAKAMIRKIEAE